uniref:Zinc finger protein 106 n=1 Tax=Salmo trutta TaxID=8032 RepID=A0A673YMQ3_SALTR
MGRERKCILCQIVYSSKQEMDEHMKSMLHHRELENLKGRDCGHECRVCRVTMVSLTDYADHISSRVHKQRVETAEREGAGNDQEEEYFDKELVKLIEIRKEYFYQKGASWDWRYLNKTPPTPPPPPPPPRKCNGPTWQGQASWDCSSNPAGGRSPWETQEDIRFHWHDRKQGRSSTWHAQGQHNVFKWCAGQRGSGSLHSREGTNKRWQQEDYLQPPTQQQRGGRGAWQQNSRGGGGSTSLYGSSRGGNGLPGVLADPVMTEGLSSTESLHRMDFTSDQLDPVGSFDQLHRDAHFKPQDDGRKGGHQNLAQEGPAGGAERDRKSGTGPKASGSNPKLDKACRWSPYPSHKETHPHPHPSEKHPKGPPPPPTFQTPQIPSAQARDVDLRPRRDITLDLHHSSGLQPTQSRRDLRAGQQRATQHQRSPDHSVEVREPRKHRDISIRISSSDTNNSLRTDRQTTSSSSGSTSTGRRATKPSECLEKGLSSSSTTSPKTNLSRASSPTLNLTSSPKTHLSRASSPTLNLTSSPKTHLSRASSPTPNLTSSPKTHLSRASSPSTTPRTQLSRASSQDSDQPRTQLSRASSQDSDKPRTQLSRASSQDSDQPRTQLSRASSQDSDQPRTQLSRASSQDSDQPRLTRHRSQDLGRRQRSNSPQQDQEQLLTEMLRREEARGLVAGAGEEAMEVADAGLWSDGDPLRTVDPNLDLHTTSDPSSGSTQTKPTLPLALKRDLTRHIGSKTKSGGGHEPNLNIARRIRNVSGTRRGDAEKDSGLKPTLRQLISSSGSRRCVNWDQVYQEVHRKKQQQGKGMPRFGIEMVSCDQEGEDIPLTEGFQWETLFDLGDSGPSLAPVTPRKRSLSESSVAPDRSTANLSSLFGGQTQGQAMSGERAPGDGAGREVRCSSEQQSSSSFRDPQQPKVEGTQCEDRAQREGQGPLPEGPPGVQPRPDSVMGDSSSGTEQTDTQGARMKRRAAGDIPCPEIPNLERKNKRLKVKSKKERLQVDHLLAVSLREEDLSRSLQGVDNSLLQARAALQAAYMEVQRLLVVKQQVLHLPAQTTLGPVRLHFSSNRTFLIPDCQPVRGRKSEHHRASRELSQEDSRLPVGACVEWKDPSAGSPGLVHSGERGVQVTTEDRGNFKPHPASLSGPSSRKSSRAGVQDLDTSPVLRPSIAPSIAPPQAEVKTVKRVRKLKKKRVLRKAKGEEQQLDNSDTELETETSFTRPVRLLGTRRKATSEDKGELPRPPRSPATRPEEKQEYSDSSLEMVVLPQAAPAEVVTIDTSGPEDRDMDICGVACPQPQPTVSPPAPDTLKTEPQKLACNEVTSTSEMDGNLSLDASSEPGDDDLPSEGRFEGHQETVNAMQVHMGLLYTCSGDRTVRAFSLVSRECVAVFEGHSTKVNCLLVSSGPGLQQRLYSGSSDQTIRCYNLRSRECVDQFSLPDRVLCLHNRWKVLYAGLANGSVVTLSLKTNKQLDVFECHGPRAVSCLATAQEGARRILLVGSYDSTISIRDAKSGLLLRTLEGHTKTVLCMKVVNDLVFSGSSDQSVHAHNIHTGELVRIYKGHSHAVTVVAILGKVMVTACLDKLVRVYELQSHDRLQVYGGHTDMVMCMAIHKSMIYTGCYDGSVQAVKLSLIQNYHCRWHGCSLIFGVLEHLQQHLLQDHASPNTQNLKCRWKNCDEYFTARNGSKQGAPRHMLQHVEEEWSKPAQP